MCNYNHDLVAQLNSGMIEVHAILSEALRGDAEGVRKPHETAMYHAAVSIRKHFGEKP